MTDDLAPAGVPAELRTLNMAKAGITRAWADNYTAAAVHVAAPSAPMVSVVLTAYREREALLSLLDQLAEDAKTTPAQIILVDNGLAPEIAAAAQAKVHSYLRAAQNGGPSLGRNIGIAHATAPLLVLLDADGQIAPGYLAASVAAMRDTSLVAVRGKVLLRGQRGPIPAHYDLGNAKGPAPISTEGNAVWRTEVIRGIGGFEEGLYGREGPVLCFRLHVLQGVPHAAFGYDPSLVLYHDYYESASHLRRKLERYAVVIEHVERTYPGLKAFLQGFPTLGQRRTNKRLYAQSRYAALRVRWQRRTQRAAPPAVSACALVTGGELNATARAALGTMPVVATPQAPPSNYAWQLRLQASDWLHPTLVERLANAFAQQPTVQLIAVPRHRDASRAHATLAQTHVLAARVSCIDAHGALRIPDDAAILWLTPPPVLVATREPLEPRLFRLATQVLTWLAR